MEIVRATVRKVDIDSVKQILIETDIPYLALTIPGNGLWIIDRNDINPDTQLHSRGRDIKNYTLKELESIIAKYNLADQGRTRSKPTTKCELVRIFSRWLYTIDRVCEIIHYS